MTQGPTKNWETRNIDETEQRAGIVKKWENSENSSQVYIAIDDGKVNSTGDYEVYLLDAVEEHDGLIEEIPPTSNLEQARSQAVEWMENHPYAGYPDAVSNEIIESKLKEKAQQVANRHAAVFQSNIMDEEAKEGVDMAVAKYGSKIGVNGYERSSPPSLEGYRKLKDMSTEKFSYEESVEVAEVIQEVSIELDLPNVIVEDVVDDMYGPTTREIEVDVSGSIDRYTEV